MNGARRLSRVALLVCVLGSWTRLASAHDVSYSYVDLALGARSADVRLTVHRADAATALGLGAPESLASAAGVARHAGAIVRTLGPRLAVRADGRIAPITWLGADARPERRGVELHGRIAWPVPPGRLVLEARLFPDNALHETFVNVYDGPRIARQGVLGATKPAMEFYTSGPRGLLAVFTAFVGAGVHHIFIGPDHILFVIGLLLLGGGMGRILRITSGFTLGHSITLALATLGLVQPPARLVEPAIALSIVYVGLDNLRRRARPAAAPGDRRSLVAFVFGLVHGFGFASVLREMGLPHGALGASLFAFNVGVELGQACIVLTAMPMLALLRRQWPAAAPRALAFASWAVVSAGGWWFVERAFLGR